MPYFYGHREGDRVTISGADALHLTRSLRARPGETIQVVDPDGWLLDVRLENARGSEVRGIVVSQTEHRPEPHLRVTMAVALLPAAALDLVLSRCTETGAGAFLLVEAERSVARTAKPERWATICREAAMLAGRSAVPPVSGPLPFERALQVAVNPLVLDRSAGRRLAAERAAGEVTLFVGPEGGWSERELAAADGAGLRSLGPRNLRADTAALAALSVVLAGAGDL